MCHMFYIRLVIYIYYCYGMYYCFRSFGGAVIRASASLFPRMFFPHRMFSALTALIQLYAGAALDLFEWAGEGCKWMLPSYQGKIFCHIEIRRIVYKLLRFRLKCKFHQNTECMVPVIFKIFSKHIWVLCIVVILHKFMCITTSYSRSSFDCLGHLCFASLDL